jgi:hypothetical protein
MECFVSVVERKRGCSGPRFWDQGGIPNSCVLSPAATASMQGRSVVSE